MERTSFEVDEGELVLLIGPSGTGKSLLLQILAGVVRSSTPGIEVDGELRVGGEDRLASSGARSTHTVGMVFQDHALFDDLTPEQNLLFAHDHRRSSSDVDRRDEARSLLQEFGLLGTPHVRAMSGGQRQRLAVARTLAQDPEIIIYDEPTTGLDVENADRVARRIEETHRAHGKTSLVVTHDYRALAPIADRVLLLDPRERAVVELSDDIETAMRAAASHGDDDLEKSRPASARPNVARRFLDRTAELFLVGLGYLWSVVPTFPRARWGLHFLVSQLRLVTFASAMVYMAIAGVIVGVVSTHFTFEYLPHRRYTERLLTDEILAGLGYLLWRVLAPVLCTILIAARCGAAVAADLGNRAYSRQLDAMRSMGIEPRRYLLTAVTWAFLIGSPLLSAIVFAIARWTSEAIFVFDYPEHSPFFWDLHFHRLLRDGADLLYRGGWWVLLKVEVAGAGVAAIAYSFGVSPKRSGRDVSDGVTRTIIWATLWVLFVHFVFAFIEF